VIALAPPLDQTPTLPTITLVGTLVTVEAPRTVKLARSPPSIGMADPGEAKLNNPATARAADDNDLTVRVLEMPPASLSVFFMMISGDGG